MPRLGIAFLVVCLSVISLGLGAMAESPSPRPLDVSPSGLPSGDLVTRFPSALDGRALGVEGFSGPELISRFDPQSPEGAVALERAEALLAAAGRSVDDLTVATALHMPSPGNIATIAAFRLRGTEAFEIVESVIGLMRGEIGRPQLRLEFISGRTVLRVRDESIPGTYPVTVYPVEDTVWFVDAGGPLLEEILAALPPAPPEAVPTYDLAAVFPKTIGGERRDVLFVQTPWRGPLATTVSLDLDGVAEEIFLATGAGYYDLTAASGMSMEVGFRPTLSAYQIAGADQAVMGQILEEILLPRIRGGEARTEPVEVAGRALVLVQAPRPQRVIGEETQGAVRLSEESTRTFYLYVSGDTIWWLEAEEPYLTELLEQLP